MAARSGLGGCECRSATPASRSQLAIRVALLLAERGSLRAHAPSAASPHDPALTEDSSGSPENPEGSGRATGTFEACPLGEVELGR